MQTIKLEKVSKTYGSKHSAVEALKTCNFEAQSSEFIAIVGPSGSGKTTLLSIIGNLSTPTTGQVIISGENTSKLSEKKRSKIRLNDLGFILQASNLVSFLTVQEQFKLLDKYNDNQKFDQKLLTELLDINDILNNYPNELSGGERQRAAIARALYANPQIILADEPTASLDTKRAFQVVDLLEKIAHEYNKTVIMITHDTRLISKVDTIYNMHDGVLSKA